MYGGVATVLVEGCVEASDNTNVTGIKANRKVDLVRVGAL